LSGIGAETCGKALKDTVCAGIIVPMFDSTVSEDASTVLRELDNALDALGTLPLDSYSDSLSTAPEQRCGPRNSSAGRERRASPAYSLAWTTSTRARVLSRAGGCADGGCRGGVDGWTEGSPKPTSPHPTAPDSTSVCCVPSRSETARWARSTASCPNTCRWQCSSEQTSPHDAVPDGCCRCYGRRRRGAPRTSFTPARSAAVPRLLISHSNSLPRSSAATSHPGRAETITSVAR
jgi:hypothetical protein